MVFFESRDEKVKTESIEPECTIKMCGEESATMKDQSDGDGATDELSCVDDFPNESGRKARLLVGESDKMYFDETF